LAFEELGGGGEVKSVNKFCSYDPMSAHVIYLLLCEGGFWYLKRGKSIGNRFNMVAMNRIEEFGRQIGREFGAERVILFGSYARGEITEDSDVDLLVVAETTLPPRERYGAIRRLADDFPASFDIIVRTPEEYHRWRSVVNNIVYFADKYGKVLYERQES